LEAIPPVMLLGTAVGLGIFLGVEYLRRVRSNPVMIGLHLLLGAGGLELVAMRLRGTPEGVVTPAGHLGSVAALLLVLAMFTGLIAPMIGRRSRGTMNLALAVHASIAFAGFVLLLASVA